MPESLVILNIILGLANLFAIYLAVKDVANELGKITLFLDMLMEESGDK